jgi:hypothetical protein
VTTTRYYLSSDSALTPAVTIPVATAWQFSSGFARTLSATPTNSLTATSLTSESVAGATQVMSRQFSVAIPSGAAPTVVRGSIGAREASATTDAFMRVIVRLVASDGTHKANLADVQHATETSNSTSFLTRSFTASLAGATVASGDLLVVEFGHNVTSTASTTQTGVYIGGDSTTTGAADAAFADDVLIHNQTPPVRQWVEVDWSAADVPVDITLAGQVQPVTAAVSAAAVANLTIDGQIAPVTADVQASPLVDVTLAGQVGPVTADVSIEAVPDVVSVSLTGQLEPVTAAFDVHTLVDASLAGQIAPVTAAVQVEAGNPAVEITLAGQIAPVTAAVQVEADVPLTADTTNRVNGRNRNGLALVRFEPTVVLPPNPEPEHERHVGAVAFSPPTIVGAQPVYAVSAATKKRTRHRILVGGKDVSFYRDVATPEPGYGLAEPLLWDRCTIDFPQIAAAFEDPGKGALRWCRKGAPVVLQRVTAAGEIVSIDYRGVVIGHDIAGKTLKVEVGGHAAGRAALRYKPLPIFKDTLDLGRLAWAAIRDLGLRFEPRMGPTTGMKQALWGGMWHGEYIDELSGRAQQRNGTQWTIMPSDAGVYRMQPKDRETVDFTVFTDDKRAVPNLRSDASEEPNRIFASGVTPRGQRVRFGVYPGLKPSKPAPYPFDDDRAFGFGTTDEDTDTGDGITVMVRTLWGMGYLSLEDADPNGGFDADVRGAVEALQDDAGIHDGPLGYLDKGQMDVETWAALFDFDVTGFNIRGARIEPAAQAPRTRRYRRSASGRIMGKNPRFDRHALIVDRPLEFGFGHTRHQMREWSSGEIARGEDNWVGTIDITTGGVLHGEVAPGTVIGGDDIMDVRAIQPGMNAWLPLFAGGILVHVSAVEVSYDGNGIPQAKLYVDTQARDAMQVWDVIRRNRESRNDPARRRKGNRASTELKDSITEWDEVGGVVYDDVDLQPGWNVIPVVAGQEGSVSRIRVLIQDVTGGDGEVAIQGREFAVAVFGKKVTPKRLRHLIGNPLAASPDSTAEPAEDDVDPPAADPETDGADPAPAASANRPWWERKKIADALRNLELLHSAGTKEEPCGYSPGKKSNGGAKTGLYRRDASFTYRTHGEPVLYLAVWVWGERTLSSGRVMWNQLEAGA